MAQLNELPAWQQLSENAEAIRYEHMRDWFKNDPNRASKYTLEASGITLDYSKNRINQEVMEHLFELAEQCNLTEKTTAMFSGEEINFTEKRAVLHTALRNFSGEPVLVNGEDVMPEVLATQAKMKAFVEAIHNGEHTGFSGKPVTNIVSIGIGGSFLGPKIMSEALKPYWNPKVKVHFVANIDGCHIHDVLAERDPETTLVLMSSKSFTTQETLQNTLTAKQWFLNNGGTETDIARHFMAVSSNIKAATEFGMAEENIFPMWDWVGGRYSLWSAIGLPLALAIGWDNFDSLLKGAFSMDQHFQQAPFDENMPVVLALLGIWYRNFFNAQSYVLLPYYHYLRGFPAYVQQLDMESNGKQVSGSDAIDYETGPIVWGSEGTNGQHSFHQLIHQSNTMIPADFMLPLHVPYSDKNGQDETHHAMLASNCFAQAQALMQGQTHKEIKESLTAKPKKGGKGMDEQSAEVLATHKTMPGNKPSNTFVFDKLDPHTLGALVALYEHKVFVQGCIWGVNSYDQWGVELGKLLGNQILDKLQNKENEPGFDASTNQLIARFLKANSPD